MKAKKNFIVVAYDIQDDKNRLAVSKTLEKYGKRVNFSVFECMVTDSQFSKLKKSISKKMDSATDCVVFYDICVNCYTKITYMPHKKDQIDTVSLIK